MYTRHVVQRQVRTLNLCCAAESRPDINPKLCSLCIAPWTLRPAIRGPAQHPRGGPAAVHGVVEHRGPRGDDCGLVSTRDHSAQVGHGRVVRLERVPPPDLCGVAIAVSSRFPQKDETVANALLQELDACHLGKARTLLVLAAGSDRPLSEKRCGAVARHGKACMHTGGVCL